MRLIRTTPAWLGRRRRGLVAVCLAVALFLALASSAPARMVDPIDLPPGPLLGVYTAAFVNQELIDQGRATPTTLPFETGTTVEEVRLGQEDYYVRFYAYDASRLKGGGVGSWLMRASSVRGLSLQEVADKFALPTLPDHFIAVRVPAGVVIRTGVAGPIVGWGEGGGQQILLMDRISADDYVFGRPTSGPSLYYGPWVGGGNPGAVAGYLDSLATPANYSDLDYVFNRLNFLEPAPLSQAMRAIGPEAHGAMVELSLQDSLLFLDGLGQRRQELRAAGPSGGGRDQTWARAVGARGDYQDSDRRVGFDYSLAGLAAGQDWALGQRWLLGLAVGFTRADFDWSANGGDGHADHLNLGLRADYDGGGYFVEGAVSAGLRRADVSRRVAFEGVDRLANGSPDGQTAAARLGGGLNLECAGWLVQPLAALTYAYSRQDSFDETNAGSLNLTLDEHEASTLVGRLELRAGRAFALAEGLDLRPEFGLAWLHFAPLDDRAQRARLAGQPGWFSVAGDDDDRDALAPSLTLLAQAAGGWSFYGRYDGQLNSAASQHALQLGLCLSF